MNKPPVYKLTKQITSEHLIVVPCTFPSVLTVSTKQGGTIHYMRCKGIFMLSYSSDLT